MQDFLNWGKAAPGGDVPEQRGPHLVPGVKVGELCPGNKDTVVLGIGSRSLSRTDHTPSGGKISSRLQKRQPHVSHGAQGLGDRPGERAGEGSKALK